MNWILTRRIRFEMHAPDATPRCSPLVPKPQADIPIVGACCHSGGRRRTSPIETEFKPRAPGNLLPTQQNSTENIAPRPGAGPT